MRYSLMSTPLRVGVTSAVMFGLVTGPPFALAVDSFVATLVAAVIGGAGFGMLCGLMARRPLEALAGLASADRVAVMRTVVKGLDPPDRRLAPAVIAYAGALRASRQQWTASRSGSRVFFVFAGLQAFVAVTDALHGDWGRAALRTPVVIAMLLTPWSLGRTRVRLDRAESSAQALLDRP